MRGGLRAAPLLPKRKGVFVFDVKKLASMYDGRSIVSCDPVPKLDKLFQKGYIVNEKGRIVQGMKSKIVDPPWIYTRGNPALKCTLWHEIMFGAFGVFPEPCLDCWKVVVRPQTVKELLILLEVQENLTSLYCKCGIEVRPFVPALYGGYFYTRSKDEGNEALEEVKRLVHYNIGENTPIMLKRYCSEFELAFGPSDQIESTLVRGYFLHPERGKVPVMSLGEMQVWRNAVNVLFDLDEPDVSPQPVWIRQHIIRKWFEFAWNHGDMSVKEFFGGENLYTPAVKYG